ncbi:hypothetical protein Q8A73_024530 [Channa argus]|nr:hypothetical protein Q8A73_024526 [Channa argus]KAK2873261.1 hypothetical protein Q8A73_024530 [Channa argus]
MGHPRFNTLSPINENNLATARRAPRLSPRVNSSTTNKVSKRTQAPITNKPPPDEYITATPPISPRTTENSNISSEATQDPSHNDCFRWLCPPLGTDIFLRRHRYYQPPFSRPLRGFSVDNATLTRFFAFHFLFPFLIAAFTIIHLLFLHETGSTNPVGLNSDADKIPFHPYFSYKDLLGFAILLISLISLSLFAPNLLGDPDNFTPANPLVTPPHIKPEWYFLFAYAILRSIPNKLGGVLALLASILVLILVPILHTSKQRSLTFRPLTQLLF